MSNLITAIIALLAVVLVVGICFHFFSDEFTFGENTGDGTASDTTGEATFGVPEIAINEDTLTIAPGNGSYSGFYIYVDGRYIATVTEPTANLADLLIGYDSGIYSIKVLAFNASGTLSSYSNTLKYEFVRVVTLDAPSIAFVEGLLNVTFDAEDTTHLMVYADDECISGAIVVSGEGYAALDLSNFFAGMTAGFYSVSVEAYSSDGLVQRSNCVYYQYDGNTDVETPANLVVGLGGPSFEISYVIDTNDFSDRDGDFTGIEFNGTLMTPGAIGELTTESYVLLYLPEGVSISGFTNCSVEKYGDRYVELSGFKEDGIIVCNFTSVPAPTIALTGTTLTITQTGLADRYQIYRAGDNEIYSLVGTVKAMPGETQIDITPYLQLDYNLITVKAENASKGEVSGESNEVSYMLPVMTAPTVTLEGHVLTITPGKGLPTSYEILYSENEDNSFKTATTIAANGREAVTIDISDYVFADPTFFRVKAVNTYTNEGVTSKNLISTLGLPIVTLDGTTLVIEQTYGTATEYGVMWSSDPFYNFKMKTSVAATGSITLVDIEQYLQSGDNYFCVWAYDDTGSVGPTASVKFSGESYMFAPTIALEGDILKVSYDVKNENTYLLLYADGSVVYGGIVADEDGVSEVAIKNFLGNSGFAAKTYSITVKVVSGGVVSDFSNAVSYTFDGTAPEEGTYYVLLNNEFEISYEIGSGDMTEYVEGWDAAGYGEVVSTPHTLEGLRTSDSVLLYLPEGVWISSYSNCEIKTFAGYPRFVQLYDFVGGFAVINFEELSDDSYTGEVWFNEFVAGTDGIDGVEDGNFSDIDSRTYSEVNPNSTIVIKIDDEDYMGHIVEVSESADAQNCKVRVEYISDEEAEDEDMGSHYIITIYDFTDDFYVEIGCTLVEEM